MPRRPSILAALAVAILWVGQFLTVHFNFGGNWTGLFCISPHIPVPDFLRGERLYIFQGTNGYDGQVFHLIAHDPWMKRGSPDAIKGAAFRYQRIFVPALAWMLAFGQDRYIHAAYFAVILAFVFLGVFWLARLAQTRSLNPAWGLAFMLVPATITSADRMTVDVALAALCVGFALYAESTWRVFVLLAFAVLTRETAALIVAGYCLYLLSHGQIAKALASTIALLPAGAWLVYATHGAGKSEAVGYLSPIPLLGFFERVLHPSVYALSGWENTTAIALDFVALAGVALLIMTVVQMAIARKWSPLASAMYTFTLAVIFLASRDVWEDAYSFGRVLSPLLALSFIEHFPRRAWLALAPMLMIDLRISLNIGKELEGIARGLLK